MPNFDIDLDELIDAIDISAYVGQYVVLEEKNGELWGLSPFTSEVTPSFSVNPDSQYFYDFSSGIGGTVIRFAMEYHHLRLDGAVSALAAYAGISESEASGQRLSAAKIMRQYKPRSKNSKQIRTRKLPEDFMDRFECDANKLSGWVDEGICPDVLGLFKVRYDPYANRIVFPVRDMDGNIINVIGRTLDPQFKDKGIAKYQPYMEFGILDTIAGYWEHSESIMEKREIILFEGLKSVMLAHTWGIQNTGAIMTSNLSELLMRRLIALGVRVVFALDAGVDVAKKKNIQKLTRYIKVEAVIDQSGLLEEKMAPVDRGQEMWMQLYNNRVRLN